VDTLQFLLFIFLLSRLILVVNFEKF